MHERSYLKSHWIYYNALKHRPDLRIPYEEIENSHLLHYTVKRLRFCPVKLIFIYRKAQIYLLNNENFFASVPYVEPHELKIHWVS